MILATRIFPPDADLLRLRRQWAVGPDLRRGVVMLLRVPPEDREGSDHVGRLAAVSDTFLARTGDAWSAAQLAADATLLGMGLGARVVLVPERGRWYADLLIVRTRGRLRISRGSVDARRALVGARRVCVRSLANDSGPADCVPSVANGAAPDST